MSKGKILVVDPDEEIRNLLNIYFTGQGYEVVCVVDGKTALAKTIAEKLPDVVIMEKKLPDMDWYKLARPYAELHIPIIFFAENYREDSMRDLDYAIDSEYVVKPFDIEELKLRIQNGIWYGRKFRNVEEFDTVSLRAKSKLIIEELKRAKEYFHSKWAYLDITIENFETFQQAYGQIATEQFIRTLSFMFSDTVANVGTYYDYIGHPQRDNFAVITHTEDLGAFKHSLIDRFNTEIQQHYSFLDRERGYIKDGDKRLPLMSLAITEIPHTYFGEQWDATLPTKKAD